MTCENISWGELDKYKDFDMTSGPLFVVADHLAQGCKDANDRYMLCREDSGADPRACLREGQVVTNCTKQFMAKVYKECKVPLAQYVTQFDTKGKRFYHCRARQIDFDKCMLEKLHIARQFTWYMDKVLPANQTWLEASKELASDFKNILKYPYN